MNEVIFLATFFACLSLSLLAFKMGRIYVYAYMATMGTITFFLAPMVVNIFWYAFSVSEIFYASMFLSTDMISEHFGKKEAKKVIWLATFVMVVIGVLAGMVTLMEAHEVDIIKPHILALLSISPRLLVAAFIMFIIEQHLDANIFHAIKEKTGPQKLWLRNNVSTIIVQTLDVLVFYPLAFYGVYPNLIELMIMAFIFKIFMALLDTPFIYLSHKLKS